MNYQVNLAKTLKFAAEHGWVVKEAHKMTFVSKKFGKTIGTIDENGKLNYVDKYYCKRDERGVEYKYNSEHQPVAYRSGEMWVYIFRIRCVPYYEKKYCPIFRAKQEQLTKHSVEELMFDASSVKENPMALQYVKNQSREMCLKAVKKDGMALQFVKVQDYEIVSAAIKQNKKAAKFAEKKFKFH